MEQRAYQKWTRGLLLGLVLVLTACAAVVYRVDPCFYYRMPTDREPVFFSERYQTAGIVRNNPADVVLLGSSMTANCYGSQLETVFGGTGFDTFSKGMPDNLPESLEAGTVNLPAILSMKEGVDYLGDNVDYVASQLKGLTEYFVSELSARPYLRLYSIPNDSGIVAFSHNDFSSQSLSELLSDKYDIATRGGYHCAPLYHKFLGTEKLGLLRVSLSPQNTRKEINAFLYALDEISMTV